jgi:hypothetical protein
MKPNTPWLRFDAAHTGVLSGRILLDAHTNPGFSGSPLTYRTIGKSEPVFNVAGVVVAFQPDESPVLHKKEVRADELTTEDRMRNRPAFDNGKWYRFEDSGDKVQLDTGIVIAWDIGLAIDLIRRYPLGRESIRRLSRRMTLADAGTILGQSGRDIA